MTVNTRKAFLLPSGLRRPKGVTLIETIVFIMVIAIALGAVTRVFTQAITESVDPVIKVRALELAQAKMDEILARKFDEYTPTGGVPACDSLSGIACQGILAEADYDDVGDYHGLTDASDPNHTVTVSVTPAGADLGLPNSQARLVQVVVSLPNSGSLTLSAYRVNF